MEYRTLLGQEFSAHFSVEPRLRKVPGNRDAVDSDGGVETQPDGRPLALRQERGRSQ